MVYEQVSYEKVKDDMIKSMRKQFIITYLKLNMNRFIDSAYLRMNKEGFNTLQDHLSELISGIPDDEKYPVIVKLLEADSESRIINLEIEFPITEIII